MRTTVTRICKFLEPVGEEQFVLGAVLVPDEVDLHGDIYDAEVVRKTAHRYLAEYGSMKTQHEVEADDRVRIVESYLAPVDFEIGGQQIKKGTWMLGVHIVDEQLWSDVKGGKYTGFSIGGDALVEQIEETGTEA